MSAYLAVPSITAITLILGLLALMGWWRGEIPVGIGIHAGGAQ